MVVKDVMVGAIVPHSIGGIGVSSCDVDCFSCCQRLDERDPGLSVNGSFCSTLDSRIVTRSLTGLERRPDGSFTNATDNLSCLRADA